MDRGVGETGREERKEEGMGGRKEWWTGKIGGGTRLSSFLKNKKFPYLMDRL